ncbi:hypothetical protein [Nocardiopsis dassonvillei]|uniref:hypothetical protein n=1 Tax=Nocardiopsis dassonvillei TaxID=2014 RepID=UPI003671B712
MALSDAETTAAHERLRERYGTLTPSGLLENVRSVEAIGGDRLDALTVIQQMRADLDYAEY